MESLINIAITVLLFVIIIILLTGLITMAIGGRFSPHFRNKLMSTSNNMKDKWDVIRVIINRKKKLETTVQ